MSAPVLAGHEWWLASRAAGVVAMLLVSVSVGLGLANAARLISPRTRHALLAVHEQTALAALISIAAHGLPWQVTRLGCRAEYMFAPERPRTGAQAADEFDPELDALMHLHMLNRGVLMTPFHMMALMSPATTEADVDRHSEAFAEAAGELTTP